MSISENKKHVSRFLVFILFISIFLLISRYVPLFNRAEMTDILYSIQHSAHSAIIFIVLTIILSIFFVPISWFIASGALIFGLYRGFLYSLTAATIAAAISFLLATFLKGNAYDFILAKIKRIKMDIDIDKFKKNVDEQGFKYMFFLRNIPMVPFVAVNYLSGITTIKFRDFVLGSFLGMVPGIFISTFFFSGLAQTGNNPLRALVGTVIKVGYLSLIMLLEKKGRQKDKKRV